MPYMKRPLLLAALALIAFAALLNPAAAGEAAAMDPAAGDPAAAKSMDPEAEADALLMPTDAEADPAATDAAATEMDMEPDIAAAEEDGEPKLIGETLQAEPEFSTLVALVTAAEPTADDLAAEGPFTLFAPVNQAFTDFLTTSGLTVDEVLANPDLKEILAHHVVEGTPPIRPIGNPLPVEPSEDFFLAFFGSDKISLFHFAGKYTAADVLAMELPAEVPTLDGHTIKIDKTTDGDVLIAGNKVVMPDIEASNGVIHGIDGVITETTPEPEA